MRLKSDGLLAASKAVAVNEELTVTPDGQSTTGFITSDSQDWHWARALSPEFTLEGHSLDQFLRWLTRENGWQLRYTSPELKQQAAINILHGSITGMNNQEMLATVATISGISYQLEGQVLTIKSKSP